MQEIWKDIPNYEGFYQVSNLGRVKSLAREILGKRNRKVKEKILIPSSNMHGYYKVELFKNKIVLRKRIHRLVAEVFLDKSNFKSMPDEDRNLINIDKLVVNHKDENKRNNNVDNLEWCTHKYNDCYGTRSKKFKQ